MTWDEFITAYVPEGYQAICIEIARDIRDRRDAMLIQNLHRLLDMGRISGASDGMTFDLGARIVLALERGKRAFEVLGFICMGHPGPDGDPIERPVKDIDNLAPGEHFMGPVSIPESPEDPHAD